MKLDRRYSPRKIISPKLTFCLKFQGQEYQGNLNNVSSRGCNFKSKQSFPIGSDPELGFPNWKQKEPGYIKIIWKRGIDEKNLNLISGKPKNNQLWQYGGIFYQTECEFEEILSNKIGNLLTIPDRRQNLRRKVSMHPSTEKRGSDRRGTKKLFQIIHRLDNSFDKWSTYHTYKREIGEITPTHVKEFGRPKVMLGSNSFLGLSNHPYVKEAAIKAIEEFGTGSGGAQVLNGSTYHHEKLCETLAKFKGTESAILFSSGYLANFGCISTLFNSREGVIFSDEKNHASIIDGCRMSKAEVRYFAHNDMNDLDKLLSKYQWEVSKLIISDGVFSMDGDICNLPEIVRLSKKFNSFVMIDEAHATGILGEKGKGTTEHFNLEKGVEITTVTLSKAIGCSGGAICGSKALIKFLMYSARPFIFGTSLPPSVCASAIAAIQVLEKEPELIKNLKANVSYMATGLKRLGFEIIEPQAAIIPIIIGDELKTYKFVYEVDSLGVFVNGVSRPAVPRQLSRIRINPSALHTTENLDYALDAFKKVGKKLGLI